MKVTTAAAAIADVQNVIAAFAGGVDRRDNFVIAAIGMSGVKGVGRSNNADKRPKRDQHGSLNASSDVTSAPLHCSSLRKLRHDAKPSCAVPYPLVR